MHKGIKIANICSDIGLIPGRSPYEKRHRWRESNYMWLNKWTRPRLLPGSTTSYSKHTQTCTFQNNANLLTDHCIPQRLPSKAPRQPFPGFAQTLASFPGMEEGEEKERLVYTVYTYTSSPQNSVVTVFVCVHIYTGDFINSPCWHASWCVLYHAVLCLLVVGYLEIKLKKEQVASNECALLWKHTFM